MNITSYWEHELAVLSLLRDSLKDELIHIVKLPVSKLQGQTCFEFERFCEQPFSLCSLLSFHIWNHGLCQKMKTNEFPHVPLFTICTYSRWLAQV